jgi:hypothetical protein
MAHGVTPAASGDPESGFDATVLSKNSSPTLQIRFGSRCKPGEHRQSLRRTTRIDNFYKGDYAIANGVVWIASEFCFI